MFSIEQVPCGHYCIVNECAASLHSNGTIYRTNEYFPTREDAQAVLDKFRPQHVWEHGDVFSIPGGYTMIYMNAKYATHGPQVFYIGFNDGLIDLNASCSIEDYLKIATFLFNIKEKI